LIIWLKKYLTCMKKCKVLSIITRLNNGGPAKIAIWSSGLLDRKKFDSVLITGKTEKDEDDIAWYARKYGVEPVMVPFLRRSLNPFFDVLSVLKIYGLIRKVNPDILHTHMSKAGFLGRTACIIYNFFHKKKVIIVHTFHGHVFHSYFSRLKTALFVHLEKLMANKTDILIAISKNLKNEILKYMGLKNEIKIRIIPLGIDFSPPKARITQTDNGGWINVGMLGRLAPIKNIALAVEIAGILHERKLPVKIVIGGSGQPEDFMKLNRQGLENILFMGSIGRPEEFWNKMDIALLTSKNEGTPVSLIEAMFAGIPFVAPYVGGIPDMACGPCRQENNLIYYKNCTLIKGFQAPDYAAAIQFFCHHDSRKKAGELARRQARKAYSIQRLIGLCKV
jgi:glycosyltransferase involved in cell wall biosynthesis